MLQGQDDVVATLEGVASPRRLDFITQRRYTEAARAPLGYFALVELLRKFLRKRVIRANKRFGSTHLADQKYRLIAFVVRAHILKEA